MMRVLMIVGVLTLAGCGSEPSAVDGRIPVLQNDVVLLLDRVKELEGQLAEMSAKVEEESLTTVQFQDIAAERLFVKTVLVVDDKGKPRIGLTSTMDPMAFDQLSSKPSILLDTTNNINGSLTITTNQGGHAVKVSSYLSGGSVVVQSEDGQGHLQMRSSAAGPELIQKLPGKEPVNLQQIPVANADTDFR